ncbi:HTH_Tnp_Tc3_2 domain-containing protein [Trichonephila clavipes]|nr:HTH_Tnp_Tc3_2 domain-containing protein [Trichonephila clavipes]
MNSGIYSASELRTQQVSIRSDSQFDGENFCCIFERGRVIGLKEGGWANRRITRHMGRRNAAIRRCWQEWMDRGRFQRHDGSGRPRATAEQDRLIIRSAVTALDSSLSTVRLFSDESCFRLCIDDHRSCVWRRQRQRVDPAFTTVCHTDPQKVVMVWVPFLLKLDTFGRH